MYEVFKGIIGALIGGGIAAYATVHAAELEFENRAKEVANQARQLDVEMVKISLSILGGEISDKTTASRRFALNALQKYSGVEMIGVDMDQWLAQGSVPEQTLKTIANDRGWNSTMLATEREIKELFEKWKSEEGPYVRPRL
jgi:predicted NACHT family NTPase